MYMHCKNRELRILKSWQIQTLISFYTIIKYLARYIMLRRSLHSTSRLVEWGLQ